MFIQSIKWHNSETKYFDLLLISFNLVFKFSLAPLRQLTLPDHFRIRYYRYCFITLLCQMKHRKRKKQTTQYLH